MVGGGFGGLVGSWRSWEVVSLMGYVGDWCCIDGVLEFWYFLML